MTGDDWLVTDPYITVVGGTELTTSGPGGAWVSETVWNSGNYASSGAISTDYAIPAWQQGVDMSANQGSTTMRNMPDVAMAADNILLVTPSAWSPYGESASGTSAAAPLWAAFTALVNEQAAANGQPPVGFINPAIYAIGQSSNYLACFHDITVGNNANSYSPDAFFAAPGYDLCTGWGTPTGSNLINALAPPGPLSVWPETGFDAANDPAGGPFNITTQTYVLTNLGTTPLAWSLVNTSAWLSASPTSGTLLPGGPAALVSVSLNATASGLAPGNYAAAIAFSNLNEGWAPGRQFTVRVRQPLVQNGNFDTGDMAGWIIAGNWDFCYYCQACDMEGDFGGPDFGVQNPEFVSISQNVPTIPGRQYLLSFWLLNPYWPFFGQRHLVLSWGGMAVFDTTNMAPFLSWTKEQLMVTATGTSSLLQFGFSNGGLPDPQEGQYGISMKGVDVSPAPSLQVVGQTNSSIGLVWNAVTNAYFTGLTYQVQYKTDLAQTDWNTLGSPVTATNLTMSVSDAIAFDQQRFYRLVLLP